MRFGKHEELGAARPWLAVILLIIVVSGAIDVIQDAPTTWRSFHFVNEFMLLALSLGTAVYLWTSWYAASRQVRLLHTALQAGRAESDEWRRRAQALVEGLGRAIDDQMRSWSLTPAEQETALLLLKGLSHREIADLTARSERTVRQHAVAVYRKSGLSGRHELAAFFLEDLLAPRPAASALPGSQS